MAAVGLVKLCVVSQMALLAESAEVVILVVVRRIVVKVGDCQDDSDQFGRRLLFKDGFGDEAITGFFPEFAVSIPEPDGIVLHSTKLTAVLRSLEYPCANLFPVIRVKVLLVGANRHRYQYHNHLRWRHNLWSIGSHASLLLEYGLRAGLAGRFGGVLPNRL